MKINKWNAEKRVEIMMTKKGSGKRTVKNCEESKRDRLAAIFSNGSKYCICNSQRKSISKCGGEQTKY